MTQHSDTIANLAQVFQQAVAAQKLKQAASAGDNPNEPHTRVLPRTGALWMSHIGIIGMAVGATAGAGAWLAGTISSEIAAGIAVVALIVASSRLNERGLTRYDRATDHEFWVPAVKAIFEAREANGRAASLAEKLDMRMDTLVETENQRDADRVRREQIMKDMLDEIIDHQIETEKQRQSDLTRIAETGVKRFEELHDQLDGFQQVQHEIRASQAQLASESEVARRELREMRNMLNGEVVELRDAAQQAAAGELVREVREAVGEFKAEMASEIKRARAEAYVEALNGSAGLIKFPQRSRNMAGHDGDQTG